MLSLNKFIEATANLPSLLQDELTTIRELDLVVQNSMDKQEREVYMFFQNALTLNSKTRDVVFQSLQSDYENILEVADEKVNIAERLQNMLSEQVEQLDREIAAFENELETENPGATRIIQKRVLKNDYVVKNRIVNGKLRRVKKFKLTKKKRTTSTSTLRICGTSEINKPIQPEIVCDSSKVNGAERTVASTSDDLSLYCICHREAFGDMVACDNELCPYEWFHYACVNMTMAPEGNWYCPKCIVCEVSLERK